LAACLAASDGHSAHPAGLPSLISYSASWCTLSVQPGHIFSDQFAQVDHPAQVDQPDQLVRSMFSPIILLSKFLV
jgi:hypothetical protein